MVLESFDVIILPSSDPGVVACEMQLEADHFPLPLQSRVAWTRYVAAGESFHVLARDGRRRCVASLGLILTPTRALPGQRVLRMESFGDQYASDAGSAILRAVTEFARSTRGVLRCVVELECRSESARVLLAGVLVGLGYQRTAAQRIPERTAVVDLSGGEERIFAGFGRSTRDNIRKAGKHGLELAELVDPRYADRMNQLLEKSMVRTGGVAEHVDWAGVMALCRELPHRSRLIGAFHGTGRSAGELVGFAWGLHHGDRVEYHTGASDRIEGTRIPILYPVLWDLITWGKRGGGMWFDLGGVVNRGAPDDHALARISDFKRGFSKIEIDLGQEWTYSPSRLRASLARASSALARQARSILNTRHRFRWRV